MIKGLAITPPVIGRISIGRLVERNGKRIPEKDDAFTITSQIQGKDGWLLHPLHTAYAAAEEGKLRSIPVRLLFNASDLNLRAQYSAFDRSNGRPVCVGNGQEAKRRTDEGVKEVACAGPQLCPFGQSAGCKLYGRLNVQIEGQDDDLGSFIFRTTGYNSVRTLAARLRYFEAASAGTTRYLRLMLKLRAKSTTQSYRAPVFYVDLTLRQDDTLAEAVAFARSEALRHHEAGVDTEGLEAAAREALLNGIFEECDEEVPAIVEEFFPDAEGESSAGNLGCSGNGGDANAGVSGAGVGVGKLGTLAEPDAGHRASSPSTLADPASSANPASASATRPNRIRPRLGAQSQESGTNRRGT